MGSDKNLQIKVLLAGLIVSSFITSPIMASDVNLIVIQKNIDVMGPPVVRDSTVYFLTPGKLNSAELKQNIPVVKLVKSATGLPVSLFNGPKGVLLYRTTGEVGAVDINGRVLWEHKAKTLYLFELQLFDGVLIIDKLLNRRYDSVSRQVYYDSWLMAIDPLTGKIQWEREVLRGRTSILCGVIKYRDRMYVIASDGQVKAIDVDNGGILGEWQLNFKPINRPILYKTFILVASEDGVLFSVDLNKFEEDTGFISGVPIWEGTEPGIFVGHTPLVIGEVAYFGTSYGRYNEDIDLPDVNPNKIRGYKNYVYALNLATGSLEWQTEIPGTERDISDVEYTPTYIDGYLYVTTRHGLVLKLDQRSGEINWQVNVRQWDRSNFFAYPPVPFDGGLIIAAYNGVYLYRGK